MGRIYQLPVANLLKRPEDAWALLFGLEEVGKSEPPLADVLGHMAVFDRGQVLNRVIGRRSSQATPA